MAAVDLWPDEKPHIGRITDGTALDLLLAYDGLGHISGNEMGENAGSLKNMDSWSRP
ncbi:hypothetical protein [Amycolatopsis sp. NPDC004378]